MIGFLKDEEGAFTLEASLVFPAVFLVVMLLLFLGLYLYQSALLGQAAATAAERAAFSWNNSHRDPGSGAEPAEQYDSLYWRLTDDGMLQAIFGWASDNGPKDIDLPVKQTDSKSLALRKLQQTGAELPEFMTGNMVFSHDLMNRYVAAELERAGTPTPLKAVFGQNPELNGYSAAYIVEPAEWIRTVELAGYLAAKFRKSEQQGGSMSEAADALKLFGKP